MRAFVRMLSERLSHQLRAHEVVATPSQLEGVSTNLSIAALEALLCHCGGHLAWEGGNRIVCLECKAHPIRFAPTEVNTSELD